MSEKRRTFGEYRRIDCIIWAVLLIVFETVVYNAGTRWFASQPYSLSVVPAVVAIVFMRWGAAGLIYSALGGLIDVLLAGGGFFAYAVYTVGNLFSFVSLFILSAGKEKVRKSSFLSAVFAFVTAMGMSAGRALVSLLFERSLSKALGFVTTDILSAVFAVVIVLIVRNLDGVFEDQKHYLIRINKEEENGGIA